MRSCFGLFLFATLETMATRGNMPARAEGKFRLLRNLLARDISEYYLRRWYRLIDWIMKLPEADNHAVWLRLRELQESQTMSHVTYAEIFGRQEGRSEGLRDSLRLALEAKFPEASDTLFAACKGEQDPSRLTVLLRAAVQTQSPEDFLLRVSPSSPHEPGSPA